MAYLRALLILQFHLVRHTMTRGKLVAYFILGFLIMLALAAAGVLAWFCFLLGSTWLPEQPRPAVLLSLNLIMVVFTIGWFWGLVMEVQRSDVIDIRKMVHFPVPMALVNAINFLVSLIGFTSLFYVAGAIGLLLGLSWSAGESSFPSLVIFHRASLPALAFYFLAASWAYYLRGLLVVWMENKRRRRLLLTIMPLLFMVIGFTPMALGNALSGVDGAEELVNWLSAPEQFYLVDWLSMCHPGGLLAMALTAVATGQGFYWLPVGLLLILGAFGYHLGFKTSVRYGYGEQHAGAAQINAAIHAKPPWTARTLPLLHAETGALAQALFLNLARHPQVRTMLLAPVGLVIVLGIASSRSVVFGQEMGLPIMALLWPFFMFSGMFFNLFGLDQRGFRTMMLLPTPRHRVLMAYHLALLPLAGGMGLIFSLGAAWYFGLGAKTTVLFVLQIAQLFLNFSIAGSFISIYAPMTIGRNMMRKQQGRVLLVSLLMPLAVAILVLPTTVCLLLDGLASHWAFIDFPIAPLLSCFFVGVTLAVYPLVLRYAGDLLMLKEQDILAKLTKTA